ncbi:MinD/ParA family protein [Mycobacterium sp. E796]|uniref:MinD/ParA family ATP-binding protein n=1 Tax=Mycobacterium sp. E796 TaxID=1834151 RepID=UPI0007FC40A0|nr:MinD/ParA family protein [Mycobacterium sp. E796]OBI59763.1 hypothetical protein A5706_01375 [Mycobacterium sp. E796]
MAADYDRLFQPAEGMEIPEEAAAQTGFDVNAPSPLPMPAPAPPKPLAPNGHIPPPMPVDRTEAATPARTEPPPRPMPIDRPAPTNGQVPPPMPVDWPEQPPARPKPPPAMPVDRTTEPPPAPPAPQPQAPAQPQGRHARRGHRDASDPSDVRTANPQPGHRANSHRANSQRGPGKPPTGRSVPPRPRTDPPVSDPKAEVPQRVTAPPTDRDARRRRDPPAAVKPISDLGVATVPEKPAAKLLPQRGWRRAVYALTRINLGLSRDEKYELELRNRIRRTIRGSYAIGVVGLKGGAGKTTVTAALGSVFAEIRGDRILAVDADQASGNLADRVGRQSAATIADLLANDALSHYNDVRAHTSMNAVSLEVLPAAKYGAARRTIGEEEWRRAIAVVPRYYNLVLADCGSDLFDPATRGVLSTASGLVIVSSASIDGVRQAAVAIDWLQHSEYRPLLNRACVVINHVVPGEPNVALNDWVRRFEQSIRPGRVIVLPWDKHVATGTEIRLDLLEDAYGRRLTELAAALSDDFDRGVR